MRFNKFLNKAKLMFIAISIICLVITNNIFAEEEYTDGYLIYTIDSGSISIIGYFGDEQEVVIPASIASMPVNTIKAGAFSNTNVKTIKLPDCVTTIEEDAIPSSIEIIMNSNTDNPYSVNKKEDGNNPPQEQSQDRTEEVIDDNQEILIKENENVEDIVSEEVDISIDEEIVKEEDKDSETIDIVIPETEDNTKLYVLIIIGVLVLGLIILLTNIIKHNHR